MFPLDFPLEALQDARPGDWVLDPFCGRGTTLYAARMRKLPAVGIDSNAVAVAATAAKLVSVSPEAIGRRARELLDSAPAAKCPTGLFWRLCFHPEVLDDICRLRQALLAPTRSVDVALRAILLGALHGPRNSGPSSYLSNQMPRTYSTKPDAAVRFWTERGLQPDRVDTAAVIDRHASWRYARVPSRQPGQVLHGDATDILRRLRRRFRWVVTSPPYPGMVTYRADQWLRSWFVGGAPRVDYGRAGQLGGWTGTSFVQRLAKIWQATAERCEQRAHLVVRFGALPSLSGPDPEDIIERSLALSGQWMLVDLRSAGRPATGRRQADQFSSAGDHVEEVDCLAIRRVS